MKRVLILAAVGEAALGAAVLIVPSLVGQLLLGAESTGIAVAVARVAGIALIGLGIACWPGPPRVGLPEYVALMKSSTPQQYPSRIAIVAYLRQYPNASAIDLPLPADAARAASAISALPK